jgi:hypothetical protein
VFKRDEDLETLYDLEKWVQRGAGGQGAAAAPQQRLRPCAMRRGAATQSAGGGPTQSGAAHCVVPRGGGLAAEAGRRGLPRLQCKKLRARL